MQASAGGVGGDGGVGGLGTACGSNIGFYCLCEVHKQIVINTYNVMNAITSAIVNVEKYFYSRSNNIHLLKYSCLLS